MNTRITRLLFIMLAAFLVFTTIGVAHSGRLDKNDGHNCSAKSQEKGLCTGYHYHNAAGSVSDSKPANDSNSNEIKDDKVTEEDWTISLPDKVKTGLRVYYLDVEQGDATLIQMPSGENILIDGGNNDKGDDVVTYLKHLGVKDIDVMIATHPDADHIGGLDTVLDNFVVKAVYAPKVNHTTDTYKDFLTAVKNEKLKVQTAKAGVTIKLKKGKATFVAPVKTYKDTELNEWSAVLRLEYLKTSFLFAGDAESLSEKDMIASKSTLTADVLKVGHHGAKTSSSQAFLDKIKPKFAVISVKKDNSYGHPTKETLDRLEKAKATVYRTDLHGTVIAVSDGKKVTITTTNK